MKSYANAVLTFTSKPLSQLKRIPTSWTYRYSTILSVLLARTPLDVLTRIYSYTGSNIVADVSYDTFLGTSATASASYEIMIWLAALGGAGPISSTGSPIATATIGYTVFKLYKGNNAATTVFSFVSQSEESNYSGDLMDFYTYLETNQGVSSDLYLQSIGAGTEPFTGSNAVLTTTAYSITVE